MQNVYDRDYSIRINWENVRPDRVSSFDTRPNTQVSHFNVPYDVGSVMHYSETTSSANGLPTMTALFNPHRRTMGQRIEATPEDLLRINRMYGCPNFRPSDKVKYHENLEIDDFRAPPEL
jgi:meprin B